MTVYQKTMREALEEMSQHLNESNLEKMRKAAGGAKQTLKMKDGSIGMDSFSASAIMQIYDKINDKNKKTFENMMNNVLTPDEKELFLTFPEINQLELVRQAAIRQKYIDQTQSLNLSFDPSDSPKWINQVHLEGWKLGIKTFYYLRTDSVIKGDLGSRMADCVACDG